MLYCVPHSRLSSQGLLGWSLRAYLTRLTVLCMLGGLCPCSSHVVRPTQLCLCMDLVGHYSSSIAVIMYLPAGRLCPVFMCVYSPAAHAVLEGCGAVNWRRQSFVCVCICVYIRRGCCCSGPTTQCTCCAVCVRPCLNYLVDPASSHMLVSKIKPCMSKCTPSYGETANGSLNQLWFIGSYPLNG